MRSPKEDWLHHIQNANINYEDFGLEWGGSFRRYDPVHFDVYPKLGVSKAQRLTFVKDLRKKAIEKNGKASGKYSDII
jgi:hypothetical protein